MLHQEEIVSVLNKALNQKAKIRKGTDAVYFCPKCKHYKRKLEVNLITGKYNCWSCDFSGLTLRSLFKKLNVSRELYRLVDIKSTHNIDVDIDVVNLRNLFSPKENVAEIVNLPKDYRPLSEYHNSPEYRNALKYLKARNVSDYDIHRYQIGYCEDGDYRQRIIVPSYDGDNNLNFFVGRSYYDQCSLKYKNYEGSKNVIGFESLVDFTQEITLVEGSFDAMAIRYNCVPLFGKTLSRKLRESLILNGVTSVNVVLDNDALSECLNIVTFLMKNNIKTKCVVMTEKDPSKLGFEKTWEIINNTKFIDFDEMCKLKMNL